MRWHYRDRGLLWPFVPAYLAQLGEQWAGDFPAWIATATGRQLPAAAFVIINTVALVFLIAGIRAAIREERHGWMAIAIPSIALSNVLAHGAGAALTGTYVPGLISAVVLYVPLGTLGIVRALDQAPRSQVVRGVSAGVAIHALVALVAVAWPHLGG